MVGYELGFPGGPPDLVAGRPMLRSHYELIADRRANLPLGAAIRLGRNVRYERLPGRNRICFTMLDKAPVNCGVARAM